MDEKQITVKGTYVVNSWKAAAMQSYHHRYDKQTAKIIRFERKMWLKYQVFGPITNRLNKRREQKTKFKELKLNTTSSIKA